MIKPQIKIETVFDSHDKNAEVMITVREGINYNTNPIQFDTKMLFGGNFIICPALSYEESVEKTKHIIDILNAKKAVWNPEITDVYHLISLFKQELKQYRKATE